MNFKKLALAFGVGLSLTCGAAQGQTAARFQDDDIDFILRGTSTTPVTSGPIQVGDVFVTVFEIPSFTVGGVNAIPAGQELTGVAAFQITNCAGNTTVGTDCVLPLGSVVEFGPTTAGLNSILALGGDPDATVAGGGANGGATIAMFLNGTDGGADRNLILDFAVNPATNCANISDCIDQASLGSLLQVDGFFGDADAFFRAVITNVGGGSIGGALAADPGVGLVSFSGAQQTIFNSFGTVGYRSTFTPTLCNGTLAADNCIQGPLLTGAAQGGAGLTNVAFVHTDFDATKLLVPEPGVLALLAAGLLGLGVLRRKA